MRPAMAITIKWADTDQSAIIMTFTPAWHWSDFRTAREQAGKMVRSVDHVVHIIGDFSQNKGYLPVDALSYFRHTADNLPWNVGIVYIISSRKSLAIRLYQSIIRLGVKKLEDRVKFVDSLQEAQCLIGQRIRA
jgi:hypothetical protein